MYLSLFLYIYSSQLISLFKNLVQEGTRQKKMESFCHFISLLRKDSGRLQGSPSRLMYTYIKPFANSRTNYNPFNGHSCLIYWVGKNCLSLTFTKNLMYNMNLEAHKNSLIKLSWKKYSHMVHVLLT